MSSRPLLLTKFLLIFLHSEFKLKKSIYVFLDSKWLKLFFKALYVCCTVRSKPLLFKSYMYYVLYELSISSYEVLDVSEPDGEQSRAVTILSTLNITLNVSAFKRLSTVNSLSASFPPGREISQKEV